MCKLVRSGLQQEVCQCLCASIQAHDNGVVEDDPIPSASCPASPSQMGSPGLQQDGFRHGTDHYQLRSVFEVVGTAPHHASTVYMSRHACNEPCLQRHQLPQTIGTCVSLSDLVGNKKFVNVCVYMFRLSMMGWRRTSLHPSQLAAQRRPLRWAHLACTRMASDMALATTRCAV